MSVRKLAMGSHFYFQWEAPEGEAQGAPSLTIQWPAGNTAYVMAAVRAVDTITAISADRRQLTVTWGTGGLPAGWSAGEPQPARIDAAGRGQFPVRVLRVVSNVAAVVGPPAVSAYGVFELAEAVPHTFAVGTSATLRWPLWTVKIEQADMPATPTRSVLWTVYYANTLDGYSAGQSRVDRGHLHVVRAPFYTGLTDSTLLHVYPGLASSVPSGAGSWRDQIGAGLDYLLARVAPELPAGADEDMLTGTDWRRCHAIATAIVIYSDMIGRGIDRTAALELAERQFEDEFKLRRRLFSAIDLDGSGTLSAAEKAVSSRASGWSSFASDVTKFDPSVQDAETPDPYLRSRVGDAR
jgi:hypothetical protein